MILQKLKALWLYLLTPVTARLDQLTARVDRAEDRLSVMEGGLLLEERVSRIQQALGRIEVRQLGTQSPSGNSLSNYEFQVYSQWGEDGIIQFLLNHVPVENKVFVEFGVSDYSEANTRFLVINNNWSGLVMDASAEGIQALRRSWIYWKHNLKSAQAFITRDNINGLISESGIEGDIGLLSIDIDGNDYWVWQAIDVVRPVIVIVEYNHRFGDTLAVTIPYDADFQRGGKYPKVYFGASLSALCHLANLKGYAFVGCNSNGVNAFFVRRDRLPGSLKELSTKDGYVPGKFTETMDETGAYVPVNAEEEKNLLLSLPLVEVTTKNAV